MGVHVIAQEDVSATHVPAGVSHRGRGDGPRNPDSMALSRVGRWAKTMLLAVAVVLGCSSHGVAQDDATLLAEDYQDWRVLCLRQDDGRDCMMRQEQTRSNGERLLAMEIRGLRDGGALGTILLPFGIRFDAGITPRVDDRPPMGALSVRTCLPSGCLAVLPINQQTMERMREGSSLELAVTAVGGEELTFPISLHGFTAAYARLADVTSQ